MQFSKLLRIFLVFLALLAVLAILGWVAGQSDAPWARWVAEHIFTIGIVVLGVAALCVPPLILLAGAVSGARAVGRLFEMADRLNTGQGEPLPSESEWRLLVEKADHAAVQPVADRVIAYAEDETNRLRRPFFELLCGLRGDAAARAQAGYLRRFPNEDLAPRMAWTFIGFADADAVIALVPALVRAESPKLRESAARSLLRRALVTHDWDQRFHPVLRELREELEQAAALDPVFLERFQTWLAQNG